MKLSRSEFLVLREIKSKSEGVSNRELARALTDRLSHQGLADALRSLRSKSLIYKDIMNKANGAHALYKSTAASSNAVFLNDVTEFVLSRETTVTRLPVAAPRLATTSLYPTVNLASGASDAFNVLSGDEDFGRKLWDVAERIASEWLDYRRKNYNEHSLKIVREYEEALATYLWLFRCQTKRWAPGASNEPRDGTYSHIDPLDMVEDSDGIEWPLKKYHITEEELERRQKDFPNASDELGRLSVEKLQKLKAIVFSERKRQVYEEYLKTLVPPKTLLLLDFGLSAESGRKHSTGQMESFDGTGEDAGIVMVGDRKSAFQEAKEAYGKKEEPDLKSG